MAIPQTLQPLQLRLRNLRHQRQERIICKLKEAILARAFSASYVGPTNVTAVERRIRQLIPSFHTPTHPTYALMIQRAMEELSEGGRRGVSEADISGFMEREYEDLPWAHEGMLRLHLKKQCEIGVLLLDGEKYNLNLVKECGDETSPGRKRRPRKGKRGMTGKKRRRS